MKTKSPLEAGITSLNVDLDESDSTTTRNRHFFLFPFSFFLLAAFFLFTFALLLPLAFGQSATRGVIRLKVKYKSGATTKEMARKRFFLIKGSLEENKILIEEMKRNAVMSRECYYRSLGASEALIKWLNDNDCESVYCRRVDEKYLSGPEAVPEFVAAYQQGLNAFKTPVLAQNWLTVNLGANIRSGFYDQKQALITKLIAEAESTTKAKVMSVMTDTKGTAYLTDIEPGTYTISNLLGSETGTTSILWACEKEVKAADLAVAMLRPFNLSNQKDPKVKCEIVERPLPACDK